MMNFFRSESFPAHWAAMPDTVADLYALRREPAAALCGADIRAAALAAIMAPAISSDAIAVLPIRGALTKRARYSPLGMEDYERALRALAQRDDVGAIVLAIESPGGTVDGTPRLAGVVREIAQHKPVVAFADGLMASAAYWIGSQASAIVASPFALIGSIGTLLVHADFSVMLQQAGIKITLLTAPASTEKTEGNPYEPLSKQTQAKLTAELGKANDVFIASVRAMRSGIPAEGFTGAAWLAESAPAGFVDEIGPIENAIARAGALMVAKRKTATGFVRPGNNVTPAHRAENSPSSDDPHMSKLSDLKAKLGADAKRFARALGFLAADPEQSVEAIETKLSAEDAAAAAAAAPDAEESTFTALTKAYSADKPRLGRALAHFAADSKLTADAITAKLQAEDQAAAAAAQKQQADALAQAQKDLAAANAARAESDRKLAVVLASGRAGPIDLGAAGGAGGGTQTETDPKQLTGLARVEAAFKAESAARANRFSN